MDSAVVRVKDDSRDYQAEQQAADQSRQRAGRAAAEPYHVDSQDAVPNAVPQGADQECLLDSENGQCCPGVTAEGVIRDQQGNAPVDADGGDASAGAGYGSRSGLRKA